MWEKLTQKKKKLICGLRPQQTILSNWQKLSDIATIREMLTTLNEKWLKLTQISRGQVVACSQVQHFVTEVLERLEDHYLLGI